MLAEFFLRSRIERIIAVARLVVALVALLVVWSDPAQPVAAVSSTYTLLVAYTGFAVVLVMVSSRWVLAERSAMLGHLVDLGVFTFLMVVTDGPSSPFFLLFTFSIVSATFRWRWKGALGTSAAVLVLFGCVGLFYADVRPGAALEVDRLLLRCAHVLVVGSMLAVFGYYHERTTAELQRLSSWRADPAAREADCLLRRWIEHVAAVFGAERVLLVLDDPEEPWLSATTWSGGSYTREGLPVDRFDELVAEPLAGTIFLHEAGNGAAIFLEPSGRLGSWRGAAIDPALQRTLGLCAVISAPISSEAVRGRMFAVEPASRSPEHLLIAGLIAEQLGAALDRLAAVEATKRAAASDERLRFARDLHDGILQTLAGTALQLENLVKNGGSDPPTRDRIRAIQDWLIGEQREMRAFIRNLRPDTDGIPAKTRLEVSLARILKAIEKQWGLECSLTVAPPELEATAFLTFQLHQIVREAAANSARHGGATLLDVMLRERSGALSLSISDNGTGLKERGRFDERDCQKARIGPRSLRERVLGLGGDFVLVSSESGLGLEIDLPPRSVEQAA